MKKLPAVLTPFVRSDAVGALLAETLGAPDAEFSLVELSRQTGVSTPVVHKEVSRLVDAGVLRDRTQGRNRIVSANSDHPLFHPMREIIAATYGPVPTLRALLARHDGIHSAYIYGSWAARRHGEQGPFPRDIDVLVIGDITRREMFATSQAAELELNIEVNIARVAVSEWSDPEPTPFLTTVRSRPLVNIFTGETHESIT